MTNTTLPATLPAPNTQAQRDLAYTLFDQCLTVDAPEVQEALAAGVELTISRSTGITYVTAYMLPATPETLARAIADLA